MPSARRRQRQTSSSIPVAPDGVGASRGYCKTNVVGDDGKDTGGEPWVRGRTGLLESSGARTFHMQMIANVAFFTGQRQGDVLAMTKPKGGENTIAVRAQKTGNTVWIPIHFAYRKWIDRVPTSDSVMLHARSRHVIQEPRPVSGPNGRSLCAKDAFKPFGKPHRLPRSAQERCDQSAGGWLHRKPGGAICNMSAQMVQHYGREVALRSLREGRDEAHGSTLERDRAGRFQEQERNVNWKPFPISWKPAVPEIPDNSEILQ